MKKIISNTMLGVVSGVLLAACGGGDSQGPTSGQTQLLADGEACAAAWASGTPYNSGTKVSYSGRNYTSAFWTQGNNPSTSSGAAGSGQPWVTGYTCGSGGGTTAATTTTTKAATTTTKAATTTTAAATTTTVGSSCSYSTWAAGTNYSLGTIVKYTNGNYYKVVNTGTNGSDGTDPTISTWYWAATTCSGGSGTTTTTAGSGGGSFVVTEAQFNQMFPNRNSFYSYAGLVTAMSAYPAFAKTGSATIQKQEAAAFLANVDQETGALQYIREINTANWPLYCSSGACGSNQYYGRGPIQLSWDFNYSAAGTALGLPLLSNPDLVATDSAVAWKTGLWYWMTQKGQTTRTAHDAMVNSVGFAETIRAINGGIECNATGLGHDEMNNRVNFYTTFSNMLGVSTGSNLTC